MPIKELSILQIETTNCCNAHCVFCPHDKFKELGTMADDLFVKIIKEASQLPNLSTIIPMLTGEPFCDWQIIKRIKYIRERLPWVHILMFTNGSLLTLEIIDQLKTITDFNLSVSLNGYNPETRKQLMGLDDWAHVVKVCHYMEEIKLPYRVTMVGYPEIKPEEIDDFTKAGGMAIQYQSWAGQQYPFSRKKWTQCVRALSHMTIRYNGDANLCCFDPFGKVSFGNVNNQTIEEIWDSPKRQEYVNKHKAGVGNKLTLCDSCTEG